MTTTNPNRRASLAALITGWILSGGPALMLLVVGVMCLRRPPFAVEGLKHQGYPERVVVPLAIVQIACAVIFLIPRTAVLGALLLTAYMGGATATHVRIGEPWYFPVIFAILVWIGLLLREPRLRTLLPLRK
jgi:hypothetical protein